MKMDQYQQAATATAVYPGRNGIWGRTYVALKLNGEAGEVAEIIGKAWRDNDGVLDAAAQDKLAKELGDVLWYVAMLATELGLELGHVAEINLQKLAKRKLEGKLHGSGSER